MLNIRAARGDEYEAVRAFYHSLIDEMQDLPYFPCWEKDVYPTNEYLMYAVERGEMYLGEVGDEIAGAMVIRHEPDGNWAKVHWPTRARAGEASVINILCVHPRFAGRGCAKALVAYALDLARRRGCRAVRLDVLKGNLPAENLYRGMGFVYVDTVRTYYDDADWMDFDLYECALEVQG